MSTPQKENGYTAIANEIMDALVMYRIPGEQMQCLFFVLRKTYGFNKKTDKISLSQFVKATGINRRGVARAVMALQQKNIIHIKKGGVKNDTIKTSEYTFNKRFWTWKDSVKKDTGSVKIDQKVVSKKTHTKDTITKDSLYTSNFLKFWSSYPKKIGKGEAFKAYKNIKEPRPSLKTIIQSVQDHEKTDQWKDKRFIPNPATWINQRRWEDEIEKPLNGKTPTPKTPEQIKAEINEALS
jgi:phage replication O-like protein O